MMFSPLPTVRAVLPLILAALLPRAAAAASDTVDLAALRREIQEMKQSYEARIAALEARLANTESTAGAARLQADAASQRADAAQARVAALAAAPAVTSVLPGDAPQVSAAGSNAFNPAISLILSGLYSNHSRDPAGYRIRGFHLPSDTLDDIKPQRGFSLGESELGIYANIDTLFYGGLNLALHPDDSVSVEEAFVQTTALPRGLTLKAGRFFSGIGYLNEQHAHVWDFVDAPLAYQAFLGGQYGQDGVQLRWLAPSETFLEIGAEAGRGSNYPGSARDKNGAGAAALFAHAGGDLGLSQSWRAGISYLKTAPRDREWDDTDFFGSPVRNAFSGDSRLWIIDGVWKWAPNGDASRTSLKLQGEYLRRHEDGEVVYDLAGLGRPGRYDATQSGWYVQGIYQWAPAWRLGLRSEQLDPGSVTYGANDAVLLRPDGKPTRQSVMIDYNPSEFSRIRLQFAEDKSRAGKTDNQLFLQYQMSLGAHGAHSF